MAPRCVADLDRLTNFSLPRHLEAGSRAIERGVERHRPTLSIFAVLQEIGALQMTTWLSKVTNPRSGMPKRIACVAR